MRATLQAGIAAECCHGELNLLAADTELTSQLGTRPDKPVVVDHSKDPFQQAGTSCGDGLDIVYGELGILHVVPDTLDLSQNEE